MSYFRYLFNVTFRKSIYIGKLLPWATPTLLPILVNKILLGPGYAHSLTNCLLLFSCYNSIVK